jgi:murein DD-endopeptidase MepM/ murein hydrolase activator NlpD
MFAYAFLFISLILTACLPPRYSTDYAAAASAAAIPEAPAPSETPAFDIWTDNPEDFFAVLDGERLPGYPVTLICLPAASSKGKTGGMKALLLSASGKRLAGASFFDWVLDAEGRRLLAAVFAIPSTYTGSEALVRIEEAGGVLAEFPLAVQRRDFASEDIPLDSANTALRTVPDPRKTAESEALWAILSRTGGSVYAAGPFTPPVAANTRRTSFFGDRRVYLYSDGKSDPAVHAGIDYGVPTGTPVFACASGRVVLARQRIVTGNSVVIEHLPGLYSIYYHLDRIVAEEGALVEAGAPVGLSGATGLATGPHLHWELRAAGENTDPDALCARPVLDADAARELVEKRWK